MAGWGGGFATGMQAGSQMVSRALEARRDMENQEYLAEQRAREQEYLGKQRAAGAPSELTTQQGLMVTGPEEGAKPFYIPAEAKDAAATYARQGYTVSEAPTQYQEARVQGGKTLGQVSYDEVAGPWRGTASGAGAGPAAGLQQDWDKGMAQRQMNLALQYGKPQEAMAYGALKGQELQQRLAEGQIAMQPGQQEAQQLTLAEARRQAAVLEGVSRMSDLITKGDMTGVTKLLNDSHPGADGGRVEVTKDPKGPGYTVAFTDKDGNVNKHAVKDQHQLMGAMVSRIDPSQILKWHESERKFQHESEQAAIAMKKLDATLKSMNTRNAASEYQVSQAKAFDAKRNEIIDRLEKGEIKPEGNRSAEQVADSMINRLAIRYGSGHGLAEQKAPAKAGRDYTDTEDKAHEEAVEKFIARTPGWDKKTDAQKDAALAQRFPSRYGEGAGSNPMNTLKVDPAAAGGSKRGGGGGGAGGVGPQGRADPLDSMIQQRRGGVVIDTPARSVFSPLKGKTFGTREEAYAALDEHRRRAFNLGTGMGREMVE